MTIREKYEYLLNAHERMFTETWQDLEYVSVSEINSAALHQACSYHEEAKALLAWYFDTWAIIKNTVITEDTDVVALFNSLPKFTPKTS